ncbi:MAG: pyridoxamine 5'-phosphate oxidase [Stappia sp.]|uniref:pyridoxamine 5'-phosphate oxidase family protein n=1 Tax=Stappia sp. TaxID=1870903 RepID=UPI000C5E2C65|nr:pyridoxamine 5'-phosphate oxidase family protein [Stappia sp.]MAA97987.1 pyridoxamine 5'-phosphate oxidase [Stappia sp.]MBM22390.1 pyridoxamine 5'-phosphate oxidase [Stappia sp.]
MPHTPPHPASPQAGQSPDAPRPPVWARTRVRDRDVPERDAAFAVLREGRVAHVGFIDAGRPMVVPMIYALFGETLYLHGAKATRFIKANRESAPLCVTVTLVDGIVVARSAFHHSMNYRCVMAHGTARLVTGPAEREEALIALTDHMLPGRWSEIRPMTEKENAATGILALELEHMTLKARNGPPKDDEEDYDLPVWAGVVSLGETVTRVQEDPRLRDGIERPASVEACLKPSRETAGA